MFWMLAVLLVVLILSVYRATLAVWTVSGVAYLLLLSRFADLSMWQLLLLWGGFVLVALVLNIKMIRRQWITRHILPIARRALPNISATEREALMSGTVGWEGSLFAGEPDWSALMAVPVQQFTAAEQAFIDGPVKALCDMIDDWQITHYQQDLPEAMWQFIKDNRFFGLIIPTEYGGLGFSATAHSEILTILSVRSATVATTVSVPNSLGPAELLCHYGTQQQKDYYLPRLARGEDIPCFALTGPSAGSDAGAIPDSGVVCYGEHEGQSCLGIRLNWDKRYITLAPVATVIGLAFKLFDPEKLLGDTEALGITCALIPANHPGVTAGRRHFPLNCCFQNGPTQGQDVFIPMDWLIGGPDYIGRGWQMLMECLSVGRAISLPATAAGGVKVASFTSGAYARIRKQFNTAIGNFEGIQAPLAMILSKQYLVEATRFLTTGFIDQGMRPAVLSAISKYHVTEFARDCGNAAMDIHGGKGICMGPNNYLARGYQALPIAITVEGANILTRNLIIFGQGAIRCHPYLYDEITALEHTDMQQQLVDFDEVIFKHVGFSIMNVFRSLTMALTGGWLARVPHLGRASRYARRWQRYSASFILAADVALLLLGGQLKRKESLSARFGDVFSMLYMGCAALRRFEQQGQPQADLPVLAWLSDWLTYQIQQRFINIFANFPNRTVALLLKGLIFPFGCHAKPPSDKHNKILSALLTQPSETRDRLIQGILLDTPNNRLFDEMEACLHQVIDNEALEKHISKTYSSSDFPMMTQSERIAKALADGLIDKTQAEHLTETERARQAIIAVDDFEPADLLSQH